MSITSLPPQMTRSLLDMNIKVLDVCDSAQCSGDQIDDYCEKEVVPDSDDEGWDRNEAGNLVNGERFPVLGRFSGRDTVGLPKRQQIPAGYFRRLGNKFSEHEFFHLDSARSVRFDEESNAGRICLPNDSRFQEHHVVIDNVVPSSPPDQTPIPMDAKEFHGHPEYLNMVKESLMEDSLDRRKLSIHESKSMDMGKDANYDLEYAELNYFESPEPAESPSKALDFVDHYLSASDLNSYKDVETRKNIRIKSPPSLRSKGTQSLARRINLGCAVSKSMTFDWVEKQIEKGEYTSLRMNKDLVFGFEGEKSGYLSVNQEADNVNLQKQISSLQSKEKLAGNISNTNNLDANSLNSNGIGKVGPNSGTYIACDSMEFDEQFDALLSREKVETGEELRLTPGVLDIGLDTQMAAEAMEALVLAAPPISKACFVHEVSDDTLLEPTNTVNKKGRLNYIPNHKDAFVGWRCKGKRSKCEKISTVHDKNISSLAAKRFKNQRGTVSPLLGSKNLMTEKLMARKNLNSRDPANTRTSKSAEPPGITVQQEEYGFIERDRTKKFQKVHCSYDRRSRKTTGEAKPDFPPKRRKMIGFHDEVSKIGAGRTSLKLTSDSSFKVKTDTAKREENSNPDEADRTLSNSNPWIHPKGKRSHQCVRHSIRSSKHCSPCVAIENNVEKYPTVNVEESNRFPRLSVYTRRCKISLEREQIGNSLKMASDLGSPSVNDNGISDRQVQISLEFDKAKPSMQCGKLDDEKPSAVDALDSVKSDILSIGHSLTSQVFEGSAKGKQLFNHSRSPLMKELMRLGYTESLPDFLPKDSRRRRAMEKVCILFSQNLEKSILKQQRKIVARLGFSIASCCLDATHFVTDRFVRTRNMLEAIALGKPVVTHLWLESCEQAGYVIHEKSYILRDERKEKEIGFSMPVSLTRASQYPLLKGHRVLITPNVKPGMDMINSLVKAVHGQVVQNMLNTKTKDKMIPDDILFLSCEEDYTICLPFLEKGASIYNPELLLNGIVTQKLEYERYQLFKDFVKKVS